MRQLAGTALLAALIATSAVIAGSDFAFLRLTPQQLHWVDVPGTPGVQTVTLMGDPSKPGFYVVRAKFPPYVVDRPHWHPNARYVTVLQGTWYTGTGTQFDLGHAVPLQPGSFMVHPARAPHWDGSASNQTVIVQIMGEGPATTTPEDPHQPFWVRVPH